MKTSNDCERARVHWMASLDNEPEGADAPTTSHLATCRDCQQWQQEMTAMTGRLRGVEYPSARVDLWSGVQTRIQKEGRSISAIDRIWVIAVAVVGWRALQLSMDLPLPWLQPVVPMVAVGLALWRMGADFLAIETAAPELQKRGV
jgi:hypothetical protein